MKTSLAPFCPRRLLIYIRAALSDHLLDTRARTHTHTHLRLGGEETREGGGERAGRIRRKVVGCPLRPVFEYLVDGDDREWIQEDYIDVPRRQIDRENAFVTRDDTWPPRYVNKHVIHSLAERNEFQGPLET